MLICAGVEALSTDDRGGIQTTTEQVGQLAGGGQRPQSNKHNVKE